MGAELTSQCGPVEAGPALPGIERADSIGRDAYPRARERGPVAALCTLRLDDAPEPARARYPKGGEPILTADGERIVEAMGRPPYVPSADRTPLFDLQNPRMLGRARRGRAPTGPRRARTT